MFIGFPPAYFPSKTLVLLFSLNEQYGGLKKKSKKVRTKNRDRSRKSTTFEIQLFLTIADSYKPLSIIRQNSILDVAKMNLAEFQGFINFKNQSLIQIKS